MTLEFSNFKSFLNAVESISSIELEKAKKILQTIGREINDINDIFLNSNNELFELLPDGTLVRINFYIATKTVDNHTLEDISSDNLFKYHIYKCTTIAQMFNTGRKHRYKINNREDGTFFYTFHDFKGKILKTEENQKLNICKNCLKKFLGKNYASDLDVKNFNLKDFHQQERSFFDFDLSEMEKGEYAQPNVYVQQWQKISTQIKRKKDYTCSECGFKPKNNYQQRFIHTHHLNGDKLNNHEDNLQVICIKCHSEVDRYHTRIKSSSNYQEFIQHIH